MRGRCSPAPWVVRVALLLTSLVACHARDDAFYARIYPCDPGGPKESCGTNRSGEPMICYDARQLGGQPVCSDACDGATEEGPHDGNACLASGARLRSCRPSARHDDPSGGCPTGLNCLRTDLIRDEGLCMAVPVCTRNEDCVGDTARRACAGALLRDLYPGAPLLTDNLQCVQDSCRSSLSACPSGESCLATVVSTTSDVPDICVPNCDGNSHCPPNFVCSREVSGPGAPRVCVPGLPGNRCTSNLDCLLGDCVDTGEGFNICTIPCLSNEGCLPLINPLEVFVCVPNVSGSGQHCVSQRPFAGAPCMNSLGCAEGLVCYLYSPYGERPSGECRVPCDSEGRCRARGGIPHVCLADGAGGCYPGRFGLPCRSDSECMTNFSCLSVPADPDLDLAAQPSGTICTITCQTDADCDADPWTLNDGYCAAGFCRLGGGPGAPCSRDGQCRGQICQPGAAGDLGTCLDQSIQ